MVPTSSNLSNLDLVKGPSAVGLCPWASCGAAAWWWRACRRAPRPCCDPKNLCARENGSQKIDFGLQQRIRRNPCLRTQKKGSNLGFNMLKLLWSAQQKALGGPCIFLFEGLGQIKISSFWWGDAKEDTERTVGQGVRSIACRNYLLGLCYYLPRSLSCTKRGEVVTCHAKGVRLKVTTWPRDGNPTFDLAIAAMCCFRIQTKSWRERTRDNWLSTCFTKASNFD